MGVSPPYTPNHVFVINIIRKEEIINDLEAFVKCREFYQNLYTSLEE
jgi:hypothetical protein